MGRRKQHCPKKANDGADEAGDDAKADSPVKRRSPSASGDEKASPAAPAAAPQPDPGSLQLQADLLKSWLLEQNLFQHAAAKAASEDGAAAAKAREEMARFVQMQTAQRLALQQMQQSKLSEEQQQHLRRKSLFGSGDSSPLDLSPPLRKPGMVDPVVTPPPPPPPPSAAAAAAAARLFSPLHFSMMAAQQQQQQHKLFPGAGVPGPQRFPGVSGLLPPLHPLMQNNYALSTLHRMSELAQQSLNGHKPAQGPPPHPPPPPHLAPMGRAPPEQWPPSSSTASSALPPPSSSSSSSSSPSSRLKDVPPTSDIFACVWCQEKLSSLAELTQHLKEANHGHQHPPPAQPKAATAAAAQKADKKTPKASAAKESNSSPPASSSSPPSNGSGSKDASSRKLILKCMWCGESFKSLAEMTVHMTETRHYTKVISQEQISSWRAGADAHDDDAAADGGGGGGGGQAQGVACRICSKSFPSSKDLSGHMAIKHSQSQQQQHARAKEGSGSPLSSLGDKEDALRASPVSFGGGAASKRKSSNGATPPKEKRKKSLPVRKLLELERKQHYIGAMHFDSEEADLKLRRQATTPSSPSRTSPEVSPPREEGLVEMDDPTSPFIKANNTSSSSILGSLEKMVESSFLGKTSSASAVRPPVTSAGLLQRLGIDASPEQPSSNPSSASLHHFFLKTGGGGDPLDALKDMCGGRRSESPAVSRGSPRSRGEEEEPVTSNKPDSEVEEVSVIGGRSPKHRGDDASTAATASESKFLKYTELAKQLSGR